MNANASDVQGATISRVGPSERLDTALHSKDRQERFLAAFAECGSVLLAARWARVHRQSHQFWMKEDPTYPARFEEVRIRAARTLEDEAVRRAKDGTAKPVLCKGKQVYVDGEPLYEHQYSDALMMFLLRAYDREKFGDRQLIELKLQDWDGDLSKLTDESVKRLLAGIEAKLAVEEARENALALPSWSSDRREEREGTGMSTAHANCSLPHLLFAGEWDGDLTKLTDKPQRRLLSQIKAKIAAEEAKLAPLVAPGATVIDATSEQPNPTPLNGNVRQLPWEVQSAVVTVGTVASQAVNFTVNP